MSWLEDKLINEKLAVGMFDLDNATSIILKDLGGNEDHHQVALKIAYTMEDLFEELSAPLINKNEGLTIMNTNLIELVDNKNAAIDKLEAEAKYMKVLLRRVNDLPSQKPDESWKKYDELTCDINTFLTKAEER